MPRLAANLTMLFTEVPFLERFGAARAAGVRAVEFLFPYEYEPDVVRRELEKNGLELVLFNLPAGNWAAGDRGIAADPRRVDEFRAGVEKAVRYARELGAPRLNCLAGKRAPGVSDGEHWETLVRNVRYAADALGKIGVKLMVEPINTYDIPDFFLSTTRDALRLLEEVGAPNVYIQYDVYHMQRMEGELTGTLRRHLDRIGHVQVADNPGRHQPGTGEINYRFLLAELDRLGYQGFVSMEYVPDPDTVTSLRWVEEHGFSL
ncbi:hydroxypyruvate isomerase [Caldinitratiruptor microaerophilus]|uniref:Hydroxypyruvate isomerase n=1 Tax=Caldinitratiruptor microaerophilus TaxID=671077 RepID=A0AA35G6W7_9FIRM|nr:hydroxypyruvate isomerase [Caldinitratiruptor microaerophilus]BDG61966.1 hydroxypyruvate isomerase [Caldinitratiruptor microaerophilus]